VDSLSIVVIACILNQPKSHWLLSYALQFAITMCLKFKEKFINPSAQVSLIYDDSRIAFIFVCFQHQKRNL
jgi:hypothetical protein